MGKNLFRLDRLVRLEIS